MKIISYHSDFAQAFYNLNIEWLQSYFYVEPFDEEVLSNPKYILNRGGHIFFVLHEKKPLLLWH